MRSRPSSSSRSVPSSRTSAPMSWGQTGSGQRTSWSSADSRSTATTSGRPGQGAVHLAGGPGTCGPPARGRRAPAAAPGAGQRRPMDDGRSAMTSVATAVDGILARHPAVGLAVGIVRDGHPDAFWTRGFADLDARTPVTEDTVFRIGSLTKTFTAVAVLQLAEQGRVDLDAPAEAYLRSFRLVPDDPRWSPPTIRQLLTHTSGVGEVRRPADRLRPVFGEMVRPGRRVPSLAEYYRRGLRIRAAPGTRWRYTGHGFAVLGRIVEDLTGEPLARYLRERVFAPLG